MLFRKTKFDATEVLNSMSLIDSCISHEDFVSVNNVLRKYNEIKEEIKRSVEHTIKFGWYNQRIVWM